MPDPLGPRAESGTTSRGLGRVLIALYGTLALAASARAAVQLATRFDEAPLAYLLSAVAAVVYGVATVALVAGGRTGRRAATAALSVELAGVLVIGSLSLADPGAFPDETVWSAYGRGYAFLPLVLPVLGLAWLRRRAREEAAAG